jgi:hypothetical protein
VPVDRTKRAGQDGDMGWRNILRAVLMPLLATIAACSNTMAAQISVLPEKPNGVSIITVSGTLAVGDERVFANIALALDKVLVLFDSPGGDLLAGIGIGKAIRLKEFWTVVGDNGVCASACGLAWLGGIKRLAEPNARIGFHAAYVQREGAASESGAGNALVGAYLNQLGMSQTAIVYLTSAPPEDMQWLPLRDAGRYGIDLEVIENTRNPDVPDPQQRDRPQTPPASSAMTRLDGYDVTGFDLADMPLRNVSREDCESACVSQAACMAYTFNTARHACFLKSGGTRVIGNAGATSGYRPELESRLSIIPITIVERTDFPGNDLRKLDKIDFNACLAACESDERCRAFTFVKRYSVCWIKSAAGTPAPNKRAISGIRIK